MAAFSPSRNNVLEGFGREKKKVQLKPEIFLVADTFLWFVNYRTHLHSVLAFYGRKGHTPCPSQGGLNFPAGCLSRRERYPLHYDYMGWPFKLALQQYVIMFVLGVVHSREVKKGPVTIIKTYFERLFWPKSMWEPSESEFWKGCLLTVSASWFFVFHRQFVPV